MALKSPRRLVIDASVARCAGTGDSLTTVACRDFLEAARKTGHHSVMTPELIEEWRNHASPFSLTWWRSMEERDRVAYISLTSSEELQERIRTVDVSERDCKALLKDCHLIEAALATHRMVVSCDENARRPFRTASIRIVEFRKVIWVNPEKTEEEQPVEWVRNGAKAEKRRQLGFVIEEI